VVAVGLIVVIILVTVLSGLLIQIQNVYKTNRLNQAVKSLDCRLSLLEHNNQMILEQSQGCHNCIVDISDRLSNLTLLQEALLARLDQQNSLNETPTDLHQRLLIQPASSRGHSALQLISGGSTKEYPAIGAHPIPVPVQGPALLNIGCGSTFDSRWINTDLNPMTPQVLAVDVVQPLLVPDQSIDVVYASHLLEHLAPHEVPAFMGELYRILKPSGILRLVVPDLEQIATEYLKSIKAARLDGAHDQLYHRWMVVELLDQLVRQSDDGGEMMRFLFRHGPEGLEVATNRLGSEISESPVPWDDSKTKAQWVREVANQESFSDANLFERRSNALLYDIAKFRTSGEVHLWMYDELSLRSLFDQHGFVDPALHSAFTSGIPGFADYCLDVTQSGTPRKPDSIYMEAIKPPVN